MTRPNVLFIMADQWHHLDFGYRNHPIVKTPNLDRLKEQSIDFKYAYAQNAFCLPSRACIFTGQYLRTHRQYGFTGLFEEHVPSMPQLFRENGYRTFHVGKYHCNPFGDRLGFDDFIPTLPEDMWQATDPDETYMAYSRRNGLEFPNDQVHGDDFRAVYPPEPLKLGGTQLNMYGTSDIPVTKSIETYTADKAIEFLEHRDSAQPFYLSLSFDRPHGPWSPSPEDVDLYDPADIPLPRPLTDEELARMPAHIVSRVTESKTGTAKIGEDGMRKLLALYYALCTRVDLEIGRVLDTLKAAGQFDDTAIVFCTDHGDMAGHAGLFDKYSNTIYHDDIIRTPFLLKLPKSDTIGREVQQCAELIDAFPTLCNLTGIDTTDLALDGKNLLDLPVKNQQPWGGLAFSESYGLKTVIKDGWKLIHYVNHDEGELYCLTEDPDERNNLFSAADFQGKRIELLTELIRFYTPIPSERRQAYIRTLFDDSEMVKRQTMGKLFKWDKGIIEGAGFWQSVKDGYRLTVIPFDDVCKLERKDSQNPTDGLTWNCEEVDDLDRMEGMLTQLIDYVACKIRPISIMTGREEGMENMLFSRGFGFC